MWFDFDRTVAITLTDVSEARSVLTSSLESFSDLELFRAFAIRTLRSQHTLQYTHLCRIPSPPSFSHTHTHTHDGSRRSLAHTHTHTTGPGRVSHTPGPSWRCPQPALSQPSSSIISSDR